MYQHIYNLLYLLTVPTNCSLQAAVNYDPQASKFKLHKITNRITDVNYPFQILMFLSWYHLHIITVRILQKFLKSNSALHLNDLLYFVLCKQIFLSTVRKILMKRLGFHHSLKLSCYSFLSFAITWKLVIATLEIFKKFVGNDPR